MKVAIKNKSEMKYINVQDLKIGNITLKELVNMVNQQQDVIVNLLDELKDKHIVKKDTPYIIQLKDRLVEVDKLEIVAVEKLRYPLSMYDMVDEELKLNLKKVVVL